MKRDEPPAPAATPKNKCTTTYGNEVRATRTTVTGVIKNDAWPGCQVEIRLMFESERAMRTGRWAFEATGAFLTATSAYSFDEREQVEAAAEDVARSILRVIAARRGFVVDDGGAS